MNRQDLLLISALYALIIAAGHSGPLLVKLKQLPWNDPVRSMVQTTSQGMGELDAFWAGQIRVASRVEGIFGPPETLASLGKRATPKPALVLKTRVVPVLASLHPAFRRVRPFAGGRRIPETRDRGTTNFDRERGPQG